jgi:hypothetical protein
MSLNATAPEGLDALIERVQAAAQSEENRSRASRSPKIFFQLEEPIASTLIDGLDVGRFYGDPRYYAERVLARKLWRWENFPLDDLPIDTVLPASLGFYPEYTYVGMSVQYNARGVPDIQTDHPLSREPNLRHVRPVDFQVSGWMPRALRWHEELTGIAAGRMEVPFAATWWRGCLDLAIQLRGFEAFLSDTVERPEFVHSLLSFLVEQRCRWWEGYERHFRKPREPSFVGDDWVNVPFISPSLFGDFVLPRYLEIERFHGGIAGIHSCGNQEPVQKYLLQIQSLRTFEVSAWTDLERTLSNVPPDRELVISLHPNDVLCASAAQMERKLAFILGACGGRTITIATSGLTPLTPDGEDFVRRVRTWTEIARRARETSHG